MASFGGSIKLTGESEYKKALAEIKQGLKSVGAEMKLAGAQMQSTDRNTAQLKQTSADLAKKIAEEKKAITELKNSYSQMATQYNDQKKKTEELAKTYDKEKQKLDTIKKTLGESSPEYKKQAEAVDKLEKELKESEQAETKMSNALQKMGNDLTNAETQVVKAENSLDKMNTELEDSGKGAEKAGVDFKKFGEVATVAVKALAVAVTAVATATVGLGKAVYDISKETAQYGDTIDKESQKLQISAKTYQELDYAMRRNGSSIGDVSKAIKGITQDLGAMADGSGDVRDIYKELGVSLTDTNGNVKSAEDVLLGSIDALARMEDTTKRNDLATQMFGKSYQEMLPLLNAGGDGIKALMQEAEDYGMVMSDEAVKASAEFTDSMTRLQGTAQGLKNTLGAELLPSITLITDGLADLLAGNEGAVNTIKQGADELLGRVSTLMPLVTEMVSGLASTVMEEAPQLMGTIASGLMDNLPILLSGLSNIASQVLGLLIELAPKLVNTVVDIVPQIVQGLMGGDTLGKIASAGIEIVTSLISGIGSMIPSLADTITGDAIPSLLQAITSGLPEVIQAGMTLLMGLVKAVPIILNNLIPELGGMIEQILTAITESADILSDAGLELFGVLTNDVLPTIIDLLTNEAPKLITTVINVLMKSIGKLQSAGTKLFGGIIVGLAKFLPTLIKAMPTIMNAITTELLKPETLNQLIQSTIEMFKAMIEAQAEFIKILTPEVPKIVKAIGEALLAQSDYLARTSLKLFMKILSALKDVGKKVVSEAIALVGKFKDNFITPLQNKFVSMRDTLKSTFSGFADWFKGVFSDAWGKVQSVFSNWGSFFGGLWETIKNKFSALGTSIASAISGSVKQGINGVISMIQNTINSGINMINGAIDLINKIPNVNVGKMSTLNLPRLARGAIIDSPTIAEIGEAGKEAVIPLENNTGWLKEVASELAQNMAMPQQIKEQTLPYDSMVDAFREAMAGMKVMLDDEQVGTFVTKTVADAIYI